MNEVFCEPRGDCNIDERSFKAYYSRWLAVTAKIVPHTHDIIMPKLRASAQAAALQCSGPDNACGLRWTQGAQFDGSMGLGEQMAALEVFQSLLIDGVEGPANNETGISKGDPSAGSGGDPEFAQGKITTADRVGAGFVTTIFLVGILGSAGFLIW